MGAQFIKVIIANTSMNEQDQHNQVADLSNVLERRPEIFKKPLSANNNSSIPKTTLWVTRNFRGIIKNEKQATLLLVVVSVLLIVISIMLPVSQNKKPTVVSSPVGDNPLSK